MYLVGQRHPREDLRKSSKSLDQSDSSLLDRKLQAIPFDELTEVEQQNQRQWDALIRNYEIEPPSNEKYSLFSGNLGLDGVLRSIGFTRCHRMISKIIDC